MNDAQTVDAMLRRLFKGGLLKRMPKRREDLEVLLALAVVTLDADAIYDESDINLHLSAWLDGIAVANSAADYVTVRRYLADLGFLRRATDGLIYRLRPERLDEVLTADAKNIDAKLVFDELEAVRLERRRSYPG